MIYHVTTKSEWETALSIGRYEAPSLLSEGFIHLSKEDQVSGVLDRYYKGISDLVLLHVDESQLSAELKYELSPSVNQEFPHLFGALNIEAVVNVVVL
jgi:uncharacterized protein (DUF952 family)